MDETSKKLKTMNEISAAEAVRLFHSVMEFGWGIPEEQYSFIPDAKFPEDIAYKDFMDELMRYRAVYMGDMSYAPGNFFEEERAELANVAANIPDDELETLTPMEKEALLALRDNPSLTVDELAEKLGKGLSTVKTHLRNVYRKLGVSGKTETIAKASGLLKSSPRPQDRPLPRSKP